MESDYAWMNDLKVGDPVIVEYGASYADKLNGYIGKVARITKTLIVVESPNPNISHELNRKSLWPVSERFVTVRFTRATPKTVAGFRADVKRTKQIHFLQAVNWREMPDDKIEAIVKILTDK